MLFFFFQAEDGIRDRSPSRGLGDVYKRQWLTTRVSVAARARVPGEDPAPVPVPTVVQVMVMVQHPQRVKAFHAGVAPLLPP